MIRYLFRIKLTGLSYTNLAKWGCGDHIRIGAITREKWASHTDIGCHLRKVVVCELTKKVLGDLRKKVLVDLCKKCLCAGEKICRKMVAWFQIYSA